MKPQNTSPPGWAIRRSYVRADPTDPHGVDGSDELEAAVGESFGGILAAIGIFCAADVGVVRR